MWFLVLNVIGLSTFVYSDHHIDCPEPTHIPNGDFHFILGHEDHHIGTVIKYECDGPIWVMQEDNNGIYYCSANGTWRNRIHWEVLPVCQIVHCLPPPRIEHGHLEYLTSRYDFVYQSIIQYQCDEGYIEEKYSDEGVYICSERRHWENKDLGKTIPKCIPVECGKAITHIEHSHETEEAHLVTKHAAPWSVLLNNVSEIFHNGALIKHQWVITSSHIFQDHNPEAIKRDFVVYVGVEDEVDLDPSKAHKIEKIFFEEHGDATNSSEYDNDIVLVKLADSISFGDHVVPICLPHEDHDQVGVEGLVTGWDLEDKVTHHHLKYIVRKVEDKAPCAEYFAHHHPGLFPDNLNDEFCTHGLKHTGQHSEKNRGAAFQFEANNKTYAVGILAYDAPESDGGWAVYTDVYHHIDWITNVTENN